MPNRKRFITFKGRTRTIPEWAGELGIPASTIQTRLDRFGWSVEKALGTPVRTRRLPAPRAGGKKIPKLCKHKASGQACVWHGGKWQYLGEYGSPEAARRYAALLAEIAGGGGPLPDGPKVLDLLDAFWDWCRANYQKNGRPTSEVYCYRQVLEEVRRLYGKTPARDFGPVQLRAVRQKFLEARSPAGKPWGRKHVNEQVKRVRRIWSWGVEMGHVPVATWEALRRVRGLRRGKTTAPEGKKIRPVRWAVVKKTLPAMPENLAALVQFHWLVGCRAAEAVRLQAGELDRQADPDKKCLLWTPTAPKVEEKVDLTYWVGPKARKILASLLEGKGPRDWVFCPKYLRKKAANLGRWSKESYCRAITQACRKAGVPVWTPRQLRKSRATWLHVRAGRDASQAVLGHTRPDTTLEHYISLKDLAKKTQAKCG